MSDIEGVDEMFEKVCEDSGIDFSKSPFDFSNGYVSYEDMAKAIMWVLEEKGLT